jgi:hypothetical protein
MTFNYITPAIITRGYAMNDIVMNLIRLALLAFIICIIAVACRDRGLPVTIKNLLLTMFTLPGDENEHPKNTHH